MNDRYGRFVLIALTAGLLAACSSMGIQSSEQKQKQAKVEVSWPYAKQGVLIELNSATDLNLQAGRAHTLVLGVVQTEDEKGFAQLLTDSAGVQLLLTTGKLPAGVLHTDRYIVNPGERHVLSMDRVQDARYVGLIAGYYEFNPAQAARLFRIPLNMKSSGLIAKEYTAEPAVLALRLALGSQSIVNAMSLTHDADKLPVKEWLPVSGLAPEIPISAETLQRAKPYQGSLIKLDP
jgi:type VI secretion system VasD/TssJ family lipoprotein